MLADLLRSVIQTIAKVYRQINPKLKIEGILLAMVDNRTNYAREISAEGKSIFAHDPKGKVAKSYRELTKDVLQDERQRQKHQSGFIR